MDWFFLFFKLVFALFLIQAPKLSASKYLNQTKSKEVPNRQAVRVPATPSRNGSSRSTIGHFPRTHRVTAQPDYAKWSACLLLQGLSPSPAQVSAGDRQSTCCAGVGVSSSLQCRPHRLGTALRWVQGGSGSTGSTALARPVRKGSECPREVPRAGLIQPPWLEAWAQSRWSWGLQYEPWKAGNMASNRKHCAIC